MTTASGQAPVRLEITMTDGDPVKRIEVPETTHARSLWLVEFEQGRSAEVLLQHTDDEADGAYRRIPQTAGDPDLYTAGTFVRALPLYLRRAAPGADVTVTVLLTRVGNG